MTSIEEQRRDELLTQARRVYWSYTLRVKGITDPDWEDKLMIGEFDQQHGVQIALEALRSVR
jgi:hypothetical protein